MSRRYRAVKINDALKRVEWNISSQEKKIIYAQKRIQKLKTKKDGLLKLVTLYPEAHYSNGDVYLDGVGDNWNKVSGMSIERSYGSTYNKVNLIVKFSLAKKNSHDGVKVFMVPEVNKIAEIINIGWGRTASGTITIYDYKNIIPDGCPRKKAFIRRIKRHLLNAITKNKLTITNESVGKDDFIKLMLLK